MLKITPGVAKKTMNKNFESKNTEQLFIARWAQLTENKFRYYKNKIAAYRNPDKPLLSVYLSEIQAIEKYALESKYVGGV